MKHTMNLDKRRKVILACIRGMGLILCLIIFSPHLFAADCTIDSNFIDRGERKAFIICGANIPSNYVLQGLPEANITIEYQQYIGLCAVGGTEPGIYLILKAEDNAKTATISIIDGNTQSPVCEGLTLTVPDRIHIPEASLIGLSYPTHLKLPFLILKIKAERPLDLSKACVEGLSFPKGKWPSLSIPSQEDMQKIPPQVKALNSTNEPLICTKYSIRALVKVSGEQRYPAKIIISKVKLQEGEEKEGVTYAMLPPPLWLSDMKDEDAKYVDVNGIQTRYFDKGKGEALLFVHGGQAGSTSNAQNFEQNFDYLSKYFHVYSIDKLGMGYTDNPKTDADYDQYYTQVVDHVYQFIKTVGINKVHLIGHSQGGWPVTRIALDHPEMVRSLVIVDSGTTAPSDPLGRTLPFMDYTVNYIDPPEGPTLESIRRGEEMWSYAMNNITDEKVQRNYTISYLPKTIEAGQKMREHGQHPGASYFRTMKAATLADIQAGKLKMPTLVIWGYNDPSTVYESGLELFKYLSSYNPGSQFMLFDLCGHPPYVEYPDLFNRTIKSFCGANSYRCTD